MNTEKDSFKVVLNEFDDFEIKEIDGLTIYDPSFEYTPEEDPITPPPTIPDEPDPEPEEPRRPVIIPSDEPEPTPEIPDASGRGSRGAC